MGEERAVTQQIVWLELVLGFRSPTERNFLQDIRGVCRWEPLAEADGTAAEQIAANLRTTGGFLGASDLLVLTVTCASTRNCCTMTRISHGPSSCRTLRGCDSSVAESLARFRQKSAFLLGSERQESDGSKGDTGCHKRQDRRSWRATGWYAAHLRTAEPERGSNPDVGHHAEKAFWHQREQRSWCQPANRMPENISESLRHGHSDRGGRPTSSELRCPRRGLSARDRGGCMRRSTGRVRANRSSRCDRPSRPRRARRR